MRFYDNLLGHDPDSILNRRGHRCKDIEEINLHNYILFAGDNIALDFNSPIEKTYPYLISSRLGTDYYNLAIFNGGIEALKYNLLTWFYNYPKPRCVVVSAEFLNSLLTASTLGDDLKVADYNDDRVKQILSAGEQFGFFSGRQILARNILLKHINVPIYQIEFENKAALFTHGVFSVKHLGGDFDHELIANEFLAQYNQVKSRLLP